MRSTAFALVVMSVVTIPIGSAFGSAANPGSAPVAGQFIHDDKGKFFSPDALKKAGEAMAQFRSAPLRRVYLETIAELPSEKQAEFAKLTNNADKDKFWSMIAKQHASEDNAGHGIYVFVCGKPGRVQVLLSDSTKKVISEEERAQLRDILLKAFKETGAATTTDAVAKHDQALLDFIAAFKTDAGSQPVSGKATNTSPASQESSGMSWLCIGAIAILGIWLVIALIRAMAGGTGGGGGGLLGGLLAGMFGAMAGMWLYNSFFGDSTSTDPGTDSGTGGDTGADGFGNDTGGGGDFGGGDFGGGDYGGGDF